MTKLLNSAQFAGRSNPTADESFNPNKPDPFIRQDRINAHFKRQSAEENLSARIKSSDAPASDESAPPAARSTPEPTGGALPIKRKRETYDCDCCGKSTPAAQITVCWAFGMETFACPACRGWDEAS